MFNDGCLMFNFEPEVWEEQAKAENKKRRREPACGGGSRRGGRCLLMNFE